MNSVITVSLLVTLLAVAYSAFEMRRRARVRHIIAVLQRSALAVCADIMADERASQPARSFAGKLSVIALSERSIWMMGTDKSLRKMMKERSAAEGGQGNLSPVDRKLLEPALAALSLACLLYDPKLSSAVRAQWESMYSEAYAASVNRNHAVRVQAGPEATRPKPVSEKVQKFERILENKVYASYCRA